MRLIDARKLKKSAEFVRIDGALKAVVLYSDIMNAPTVDAVPVVQGEWEHLESGWHDLWRCTSCGDEWTFEYDPTDKETMVNFCPHCGADMRERKGNEDG